MVSESTPEPQISYLEAPWLHLSRHDAEYAPRLFIADQEANHTAYKGCRRARAESQERV